MFTHKFESKRGSLFMTFFESERPLKVIPVTYWMS